MDIDSEMQWGILLTGVHSRIRSLLIAYRATDKAISEMKKIEWYDPKASRSHNKQVMKDLGGAMFSYRKFLTEMMILGIAKSNEDLAVDIYDVLGREFVIWERTISLKFLSSQTLIIDV